MTTRFDAHKEGRSTREMSKQKKKPKSTKPSYPYREMFGDKFWDDVLEAAYKQAPKLTEPDHEDHANSADDLTDVALQTPSEKTRL